MKIGKKSLKKGAAAMGTGTVAAGGILFSMPALMLLAGSVTDAMELSGYLGPMLSDIAGYVRWKWVPDYPTLVHYKNLLFYSPAFLKLFWNSVGMVFLILAGQLLVGVPGAWSLAVYRFPGRSILFTLYVILMLLPFQVTMLSGYLVLESMGLLNTTRAVVLPAVFSTFPVFLIYRGFRTVSPLLLDAARMDGAGEWKLFWKIGLPLAREGIYSAIVLGFLEYWNMMEEPLAYLKDKQLWPLSLYLPEIRLNRAGYAFAASFITLVPSVFVFAIFRDSLERGIIAGALKE